MNFIQAIKNEKNSTTTENGMHAFKSTGEELLDLYSIIGACRTKNNAELFDLVEKAYNVDRTLAIRLLMYARDIRGGLGERDTFRKLIKYMAMNHPNGILPNIKYIPEFGRWDDLFELMDTPCEYQMMLCIHDQLMQDKRDMKEGLPISLLAKWMPTYNSKSSNNIEFVRKFCHIMNINKIYYRKLLVKLRKHTDVLETKMCNKDWESIEYSKVPSKAMIQYKTAFFRNDEDRFRSYLEDVSNGVQKINSSTLFPSDIVHKFFGNLTTDDILVLENQWKSLPNYIEGQNDVLVMADTSGSMCNMNYLPLATSVALAIYFAQRNKGTFANMYMTFSERPEFIEVINSGLYDNLKNIARIDCYNTNIESAFNTILQTAKDNQVKPEDLPKSLIIISDMQFDQASGNNNHLGFYENMKQKFRSEGYELPKIVFWNVYIDKAVYHINNPHLAGVHLVSGYSASVFKSILDNLNCTAYEQMMNVLNSERYSCIRVD